MTGAVRRHNNFVLCGVILAAMAVALGVPRSVMGAGKSDSTDRAFLVWDIQIEIQQQDMGRLAARRALTKEVRDLGSHLVERHQQAQRRLEEVARRLGIALSHRLSETHLRVQRHYAATPGARFDKAFVHHEVGDYRYFLSHFEAAARSGSAPVRAYAAHQIPQLKADQAGIIALMHRQMSGVP
ncbi:MAG TPA: DUF4142 domain-containing protein [Stellaceae bacterium]|nr:DUF4142 domain-containing protein [Stellaceae bacterium]